MKKVLLLFALSFSISNLFAQTCSELFISEYVEGYSNNKAIEIYNPTNAAIDLSQYGLARFSNGATTAPNATPSYFVQLPSMMIAADDVFVIVLDKQVVDASTITSTFDKPVWNGYNEVDTLFDNVTGLPLTDGNGNILIGPQYDVNGAALFQDPQTTYYPEYDLQGQADAFLCPDYSVNRVMYFNGNDAMALVKGTSVAGDGSNIVDIVGVIGEDPTVTIMQDAWVDNTGSWVTKDKSISRGYTVEEGTGLVVYAFGDTLAYSDWDVSFKNDFSNLGEHDCSCFPTATTYINNDIAFDAFPNPTSGNLHLSADEVIENVEFFNTLGQGVLQMNVNSDEKTLNVSLAPGIYMMAVDFGDNNRSLKKIVIQ